MTSGVKGPLAVVADVRREEWPITLLMFGQFFLVITTFWILKPLKKVQFFSYYGSQEFSLFGLNWSAAQAELVAKVANLFVAYCAVVFFSLLVRKFRRQQLVLALSGVFATLFLLFALFTDQDSANFAWGFYLIGDLYNSLMLAAFFAFLNDSIAPADARRLYGPIVLGGVLGGVFGTTTVAGFVGQLSLATWLMVCIGVAGLIALMAAAAGRLVTEPVRPPAASEPAQLKTSNPALDGAKLVLRSPYLLSIVAIVGLYEIVSTVMDFQFSAAVEHFAELGRIDAGQTFATTYAVTNWVALLVQLFGTGLLMSRFKIGVALLVLPAAALGASTLFAIVPLVWFASALNTADNGLNYSVNQSAKEALYTVATKEERYLAKAFVDVFVQRFAKAVAVFVSLGITFWFSEFQSVRLLSLFTGVVIVLWIAATRYASRRFEAIAMAEADRAAQRP